MKYSFLLFASQHAALRVHGIPYQPRTTVAAINYLAAMVRAAKVEFPPFVAQRRRPFQACVARGYEGI